MATFDNLEGMTAKQFFDWQTSGGTDDVMRLVDCLERADIAWCATGGVTVNHWAEHPMVTQDVDFVVAADAVARAVKLLEAARRQSKRIRDLADIVRMIESHPRLWDGLTDELKRQVQRPEELQAVARDTTHFCYG